MSHLEFPLNSIVPFSNFYNNKYFNVSSTVEPPKKGHFGEFAFVLCGEVVLFLEVLSADMFFITLKV